MKSIYIKYDLESGLYEVWLKWSNMEVTVAGFCDKIDAELAVSYLKEWDKA